MTNTWYTFHPKEVAGLESFCRDNGLEMQVHQRTRHIMEMAHAPEFYATVPSADIKGDGVLTNACGNGATIDEALKDYANIISGEVLVINAFHSLNRREIAVPELTYEPCPATR